MSGLEYLIIIGLGWFFCFLFSNWALRAFMRSSVDGVKLKVDVPTAFMICLISLLGPVALVVSTILLFVNLFESLKWSKGSRVYNFLKVIFFAEE